MILTTNKIRLCGSYGIFYGDSYLSRWFFHVFYERSEAIVWREMPRDLVIGALDPKE